jgi:hypothetical protein
MAFLQTGRQVWPSLDFDNSASTELKDRKLTLPDEVPPRRTISIEWSGAHEESFVTISAKSFIIRNISTRKKRSPAMTLTIDLPDNLDAVLKAQAHANGISEASFARKVLEQFLDPALTPVPEEKTIFAQSQPRPLSARIREIWADMPDDVRAKYPEGGAYQIDHHLYGLPKR